MTPPSTIPQIMKELQTEFPHLPAPVIEWISERWNQDRYDNNVYGAFKRTKVNQSEDKQAA